MSARTWVVLGAVVLAAALLEDVIRLEAQNHPWRVAIVGGVVFLVIGLALVVFPARAAIAAAAFLFGAWAIGLVAGLDDRDHELGDYCRYGASSQAEIDDCMERVDTDEIAELDTPAARFARGETNVCGPGSGRYCAAAARGR